MKRMVVPACVAALLSLMAMTSAYAQTSGGGGYTPQPNRPTVDTTAQVVMTDSGAQIVITMVALLPGSPSTPGSSQTISGPAPQCGATPGDISPQAGVISMQDIWNNPNSVPFLVSCDSGYLGIVWVPIDAGPPDIVVEVEPGSDVDPLAVAEMLLGMVPLPPIDVGVSPATGLVALPSWFWMAGYDGSTLTGSETLGDTTVEVEITPERYDWRFGDGHAYSTTSIGKPYPEESDIAHTYEQSSAIAAGTFDVVLEIVFAARYRVTTVEEDADGNPVEVVGDWEPLEPIVRSFVRPYPVQQVQSVGVGG